MKAVKLSLVIMAVAVLTVGLGGMAYAFHAGGVADCAGCHQMHNAASASFLLIKSDPSSTCLNCHQHAGDTGPSSYHISTAPADMPTGVPPLQRTPGGDFGWLKKTYNFVVRGTAITETGDSHGHNIIATDFGYTVDGTNSTAPGGGTNAFLSSNLSCVSCHDMHGEYRRDASGTVGTGSANLGPIIGSGSYDTSFGNSAAKPIPAGQAVGVYRLLWGANPSTPGIPNYPGVPAAVAPQTYNRTEATNQTRVAYGLKSTSGHAPWGQWCGTCHSGMLSGTGNHTHPVDQGVTGAKATNYTNYVSSGNMSGNFTGANQVGQGPYLSLVPFVEGTSDYTLLGSHAKNDGSQLGGPTSNDQVSCFSCHRAHATGFQNMLRWNGESPFLTETDTASNTVSWPGTDVAGDNAEYSRGHTKAETQRAYYDRNVLVFGAFQRSLCNKCHAKD